MEVWSKVGIDSLFTTNVERSIQKYIQQNVKEVPYMTIRELSSATKTSDSAITRFCHKIGVSGYKELKVELSQTIPTLERQTIQANAQITRFDSVEEVFVKTTELNTQALRKSALIIDFEVLKLAIDTIDQARNVHIVAFGNSGSVATDAMYKFRRIQIQAQYTSDYHMQLLNSTYLTDQDVVLAISVSGKTKEIVQLLKIAKEKKAKTISIVQLGNMPSDEYTDIKICIPNIETETREGSMAARTVQLNIIDSIFTSILCRRLDKVQPSINESREFARYTKIEKKSSE